MVKKDSIFQFRLSLAALVAALAVYSALVISMHWHTRLTADSMLYFSIAQKYLSGDFANAINGYWGPLLSWLLMPFLYFGVSDIAAINALNLVFGIFTITGVWILSFRFGMSDWIRGLLLIALCPVIVRVSIVQPMDFLLLCILLWYLCIVFKTDYSSRAWHGVLSGVLGAIAYFTKAYAFPFFISHFLVMNIFHFFRNPAQMERKNVLRSAMAGLVIFFLISGIWIGTISNKYGFLTFSTMSKTNFNSPGPEAMGGGLEFGVPVFYEGFFAPPNETAFVVWEDPSYLEGRKWSAWESLSYFKHFIKLLLKNAAEGLLIFESFSTFAVTIIVAYLLLLSAYWRESLRSRSDLLYPLFTLALFSGGYLLFHFEQRYLWLINILLLLMGGHLLHLLFRKEFFNSNVRKGIVAAFFIISFIFTPSRHLLQAKNSNMDMDMYYVGADLKRYNIKGNIASNREYVPVHDAWHKTFRLAYWLNGRYYGQPAEKISDEELENELERFNIDYFFYWGEPGRIPDFLSGCREVTNGEIPGLRIYSLHDRNPEGPLPTEDSGPTPPALPLH